MKIDIENLGGIDKGSIELNDFTIFCGKNNSGKTYAMYSIYGLLDNKFNISFEFVKPIVDRLKQEGSFFLDIDEIISEHKEEMISHIEESFKDYLPNLFGVTDSEFSNTKIKLYFSNDEIKERIKNSGNFAHASTEMGKIWKISLKINNGKIQLNLDNTEIAGSALQSYISEKLAHAILFDWLFSKHSFLLPAERDGINLFFKELFSIRNLLLQQAQNDNVNPMHLLKDILKSRYAEPVKDYMQLLNKIGSLQKEKSDYYNYAKVIQKNVLGGKYEVDDFGNVFFIPSASKNKLPLHFSSSTVKTLFGLVFYLEHLAEEGDYLMIDEPELNLHPDNQRQVARVLVQLVNAGLKVIVSTHSNYFMREINNMIMLGNDFKGVEKLRKKYKYQSHELLNNKRISAYLFDKNEIKSMQIDEEGVIADTFDTVTDSLNQSSNDIYYTMQDAKEIDD